MGLIAQEIKELRRMVKLFDAGKVDASHVETKLKIFKESHKRSQLILNAMIACSRPHLIESRLHDFNVLSRGEFVQTPDDVEVEMVVCPDQNDKAISRSDCLNYSGDSKNIEQCKSCDNFAITRKLLLSEGA